MRKKVRRILILFFVFIFGVIGFSCLMNSQNTDNKTDLQTASIPCMAMKIGDMQVNRMYGYKNDMQADFMRDTLTPLGTDKTLKVNITPYNTKIESLVYEIRTSDGSKVIENNKITHFQEEEDGTLSAEFTLQKSILMNQEYSLNFTLKTENGSWNYYTRLIQRAGLSTEKYIEFVNSFYTKTFEEEGTADLKTYLETDDSGGNNSFNDLNIHSSLDMVTWKGLEPEISRPGIPSIKDINENTGSVSITYYMTAENEKGEIERYQVDEFYRMRYDQTRIRLLDFKRSAKQILTTEQSIVTEGQLNLGVTDKDVQYLSDSTGEIVAFVQQGDLWSYNLETNKMNRIFSFRDLGSNDERNDYSQHDIDIVRVDKNGDVDFVLYGYMNRGQNEGCVGTAVYHYWAEQNVIEEQFFLSSTKSFEFLKQDIDKFTYISKTGYFYMLLDGDLYQFSMEDKQYKILQENVKDNCFKVSESGRYVAWLDGMDINNGTSITMMDMETQKQEKIQAEEGTKLRLFGFMNNDAVYGIANDSDIVVSDQGTEFAMNEIRIQNMKGEVKKTYQEDGYYVMDVKFQDNLLELVRAQWDGDNYQTVTSSQILNNVRDKQDKTFSLVLQTTERQANIMGLQFEGGSKQEPLVMDAKFMETTRDNVLNMERQDKEKEEYYVYAMGKLWGIYENAAEAINAADTNVGVVLNKYQQYVWERGNTADKATIALEDIPDGVKKVPLNVEELNKEIQKEGQAVDMTGCTLSQILYQISAQRPVIVKGEGGNPKVIVGFDGYNTYLYDPASQTTSPMGMNDSTKAFEENGNVFICYMEKINE